AARVYRLRNVHVRAARARRRSEITGSLVEARRTSIAVRGLERSVLRGSRRARSRRASGRAAPFERLKEVMRQRHAAGTDGVVRRIAVIIGSPRDVEPVARGKIEIASRIFGAVLAVM